MTAPDRRPSDPRAAPRHVSEGCPTRGRKTVHGHKIDPEKKASLAETLVQFVRYGMFGALCSATDTVIFWFLTSLFKINPLLANVFSTSVGVAMSFYFNRRFTFKVRDKTGKRCIAFFSIGLLGLLVSEGIIGTGMHVLPGLPPVFVKLLAVMIVGCFQFFLNRNITFRTVVDAQDDDDEIV